MILADALLRISIDAGLVILSVAFLLTVVRVLRGPSLADRVLALDMLVAIAIGFVAVIAIRTGFNLYIDIAISLGLVGFLATVAFARFIFARGLSAERAADQSKQAVRACQNRTGQKSPARKKDRRR